MIHRQFTFTEFFYLSVLLVFLIFLFRVIKKERKWQKRNIITSIFASFAIVMLSLIYSEYGTSGMGSIKTYGFPRGFVEVWTSFEEDFGLGRTRIKVDYFLQNFILFFFANFKHYKPLSNKKKMTRLFSLLMVLGITLLNAQKVIIKTDKGNITVKLYPKKAPITVTNFLKYVDDNAYANAAFYRTVRLDNQKESPIPIQVIQGGVGDDEPTKSYPAIPLERTNKTGLSHKVGAISMARGNPDSATTEFFIIVNRDQPQLDFGGKRNPDGQGFAVFGKVVKGMEIVNIINKSETVMWDALQQKQWIKEPVKIISIKRK